MGAVHFVKVGLMGAIGRFQTPDFARYPRSTPVICRTNRGLEMGEVVCADEEPSVSHNDSHSDSISDEQESIREIDGQLLRAIGSEDQLIIDRLERYRDKAFHACQKLIAERNLTAILVDVEHLFDGESLFFYFLGDVNPELDALTSELAEAYERKVRFKKFAETLAEGCGPDCGTGASCASSGCGSCALSGKCKN